MLQVRVNAERAGRVVKPARYIEVIDPETGENIATLSISREKKYGGAEDQNNIRLTIHGADTKALVSIDNEAVPELMGHAWHGSGGMFRWDPREEDKTAMLKATVSKIVKCPVEITKTTTRLEVPEDW